MKKIFYLVVFCLSVFLFGQQTSLQINNYSIYDYHGVIIATDPNNCSRQVSNTYYPTPPYQELIVGAGVMGNIGLYSSGNYVPYWDVVSSATNPLVIRYYTHPQIAALGVISQNTNWSHSKFEMCYAGTNNHVIGTQVNLSPGTSPCSTADSYFSNPSIPYEVEWFEIGGYSYIQIY